MYRKSDTFRDRIFMRVRVFFTCVTLLISHVFESREATIWSIWCSVSITVLPIGAFSFSHILVVHTWSKNNDGQLSQLKHRVYRTNQQRSCSRAPVIFDRSQLITSRHDAGKSFSYH